MNSARHNKGFTLIEVSIVLVIAGLFLLGWLQFGRLYIERKLDEQKTASLDAITSSLADYVRDDSHADTDPSPMVDNSYIDLDVQFPCPADPALAPGDAGFGEEVRDATGDNCAASGGITEITVAGGTVYVGALPTATMKLGAKLMLDPYRNKFTYAVSSTAAQRGSYAAGSKPEGLIDIEQKVEPTGANPTPAPITIDDVPFVVLSHGPNGSGAYSVMGNQKPCPALTDALDAQNCDFTDAVFQDEVFSYSSAGTSDDYDDTLVYSLAGIKDKEDYWGIASGSGQDIRTVNTGNVLLSETAGAVAIGKSAPDADYKFDVSGKTQISDVLNIGSAAMGTVGAAQASSTSIGGDTAFISSPWLYTSGITSQGSRDASDGAGIALGATLLEDGSQIQEGEVAIYTSGGRSLLINENGNIRIGNSLPTAISSDPSNGSWLLFEGGGRYSANNHLNSDPLGISRYTVSDDMSELQVLIGDNYNGDADQIDSFVVGARDWTSDDSKDLHGVLRVQGNSRVGINEDEPLVALDVNGEMILGDSAVACTQSILGALRLSGETILMCRTSGADYVWENIIGADVNLAEQTISCAQYGKVVEGISISADGVLSLECKSSSSPWVSQTVECTQDNEFLKAISISADGTISKTCAAVDGEPVTEVVEGEGDMCFDVEAYVFSDGLTVKRALTLKYEDVETLYAGTAVGYSNHYTHFSPEVGALYQPVAQIDWWGGPSDDDYRWGFWKNKEPHYGQNYSSVLVSDLEIGESFDSLSGSHINGIAIGTRGTRVSCTGIDQPVYPQTCTVGGVQIQPGQSRTHNCFNWVCHSNGVAMSNGANQCSSSYDGNDSSSGE